MSLWNIFATILAANPANNIWVWVLIVVICVLYFMKRRSRKHREQQGQIRNR